MPNRFKGHDLLNIPDHTREALERYFLYALEPGGFVTSLLSNDPILDVIGRADHWNKKHLPEIVNWLYSVAPMWSWGDRNTVQDWLNKGNAYQAFQKEIVWETLNSNHDTKQFDF